MSNKTFFRVKEYQIAFEEGSEELFKVSIILDKLDFQLYKTFFEFTSSAFSDDEARNLIKKYRFDNKTNQSGFLAIPDLRPINNKNLYTSLVKKLPNFIYRNLDCEAKNPQIGLIKDKFGSCSSIATAKYTEGETVGEEEKVPSEMANLEAEPKAEDLLKILSIYDSQHAFRSYSRRFTNFFKIKKVVSNETKLNLVEYALSNHDREYIAFENVRNSEGENYDLVMGKLTRILDGDIEMTRGEIIRALYDLKLSDFNDVISYHNRFLELSAKDNGIEEQILVDAFVSGITVRNVQTTIQSHKHTTLYENFEALKRLYKPGKIQVNGARFSGKNPGNYSKNTPNSRNNKSANKNFNFPKNNNRSDAQNWRNTQNNSNNYHPK